MPAQVESTSGRVFGSLARSVSWVPTIAFSWLWGLGFFYAIHVTLTYGWLGFLAFAGTNAGGLCLFGWILGAPGRDPARIFAGAESAYAGLFLLAQLGALSITIFTLVAYLWLPLALPSPLVGVGLLLLIGCAVGHAAPLRRLRWVHAALLALGIGAALTALASLAQQEVPAALAPPFAALDARFYGLVVPTLVGFGLGPWTDVQQWQRVIEIRRGGGSVRAAYGLGALLFLGLLGLNAGLAALSGTGGALTGADGVPVAYAAVTMALAGIAEAGGSGTGSAAFAVWTGTAVLAQVASAYGAVRWWLGSVTARSNAPLLAIIPAGLVASPLWIVLAGLGVAYAAVSANLSLIYLMLPFATVLVAAAACLLCESLGAPRRYDSVLCWLVGFAAALVFLIGHVAPNAALVAVSPLIGLVGALPMMLALVSPSPSPAPAAARPALEATPKLAVLTVAETDATASYGFEGQWFVLRMMPTYDDTNSVGNVYFANYVRWVGKARELFFNICMPEFDLKTTSYYILTKNFEHEFRREAAEFEAVTIRIRIARHNRKFVTLTHEIHSDAHGLLGRGEQGLMFVDTKTYHPLDIPRAIVQGFLRYWPKDSPHGDGAVLPASERRSPEPAALVR